MNEKEMELIEKAMELFMRAGIKSATMDDVARHLGISKKTLYNQVTDKNDLVEKVLMYANEMENRSIDVICEKKQNAIDESYEISQFIFEHINTMHPSIIYDLQKYHAQQWNNFVKIKQEKINECYTKNIVKGIEEGLYRDNLKIPVIVKFYTSRFDVIFDETLFPRSKYKAVDIYLEIFRYHIRGIASEKGIKYLVEKIKKEKLNS